MINSFSRVSKISSNQDISLVKRGNLKRSKIASTQPMNENNFMNSGLGDEAVDQKDGSITHIPNTAQGQGKKNQ